LPNWFQKNQLILNLNETNIVKYIPSQLPTYPLSTTYNGQLLKVAESIRFLGLQLDSHLNWKLHSEELSKKLSSVCYMMRKLSYTLNLKTLWMVYFAYFYSIVSYGIIFWGSSASLQNAFLIQKRVVRIMLGLGHTSSCTEAFKKLDILTVPSIYIYAMVMSVVGNPDIWLITYFMV
jgi:hypothetical protein